MTSRNTTRKTAQYRTRPGSPSSARGRRRPTGTRPQQEASGRILPGLTRGLTVLMLGFYSLVAQTLLFRDFISSTEDNEFAIAIFFGSWLIWVGIGGLLIRLFIPWRENLQWPGRVHTLWCNWRAARKEAQKKGASEDSADIAADAPAGSSTGSSINIAGDAEAPGSRNQGPAGAPAAAVRNTRKEPGRLIFTLLVAAYPLAGLLQQWLTFALPGMLGLEVYQVVPLPGLVSAGILANAPTSLLTGMLFPLACKWLGGEKRLSVGRSYALETLGGCLGGIVVTVLLWQNLQAETIWIMSSLMLLGVLASSLVAVQKRVQSPTSVQSAAGKYGPAIRVVSWLAVLALLAGSVPLALKLGPPAASCRSKAQWNRLLDGKAEGKENDKDDSGSFTTARGRYLYGIRDGEFLLVSHGSIALSIPAQERGAELAAYGLAQQPAAHSVLLIGPEGPAIGERLQLIPQIEKIVWLARDPDLPVMLKKNLPVPLQQSLQRIITPQQEIRSYLSTTSDRFDLVISTLGEAASLADNRYATPDFYAEMARVLTPDGVCMLRVQGGENYLGRERELHGTAALHGFRSVFGRTALKPGEESFLFGSGSSASAATTGEGPTSKAAELVHRFHSTSGSERLYPVEALRQAFDAGRVEYQLDRYRQAESSYPPGLLSNSDQKPQSLLYELMLKLRSGWLQDGPGLLSPLLVVLQLGVWPWLVPVFLYAVLRLFYRYRSRVLLNSTEVRRRLRKDSQEQQATSTPGSETDDNAENLQSSQRFEPQFMVFTSGLVAMATSALLLFAYQMNHGSLFVDLGIISALFMFGASLGGWLGQLLLIKNSGNPLRTIMRLTLLHTVFLLLLVCWPPLHYDKWLLNLCIFCGGWLSGFAIPLGVRLLLDAGGKVDDVAGRLEFVDHLGGGLGALCCTLVLLPLLGMRGYLILLLAMTVTANLLCRRSRGQQPLRQDPDRFRRIQRPIGYVMLGLALWGLIFSQAAKLCSDGTAGAGEDFLITAHAMARSAVNEAQTAAPHPDNLNSRKIQNNPHNQKKPLKSSSGNTEGVQQLTGLTQEGESYPYLQLNLGNQLPQYIFPSTVFAGDILGYGGPLPMVIRMRQDGRLEEFRLLRNNETPAYLHFLADWMKGLVGKNLLSYGKKNKGKGAGKSAGRGPEEIDAVSGATLSSAAILSSLSSATRQFAEAVLHQPLEMHGRDGGDGSTGPVSPLEQAGQTGAESDARQHHANSLTPAKAWAGPLRTLILILLAGIAISARLRPQRRFRQAILATCLLVCGLWLNLQYSSQQVMALLGGELRIPLLSTAFFLTVLLPLITLLVGNIYCGYLCPFGALQELIGELRPRQLTSGRLRPSPAAWRALRSLKYVLLFFLVMLFCFSRDYALLEADPLITFFGGLGDDTQLLLALWLLCLCLFFPRFWCRNLCPTGAFLSLLGSRSLLRRRMPTPKYPRCDLGVSSAHELDCLQCDRCRHEKD